METVIMTMGSHVIGQSLPSQETSYGCLSRSLTLRQIKNAGLIILRYTDHNKPTNCTSAYNKDVSVFANVSALVCFSFILVWIASTFIISLLSEQNKAQQNFYLQPKVNRPVQGVSQSQTAANPRHQEE